MNRIHTRLRNTPFVAVPMALVAASLVTSGWAMSGTAPAATASHFDHSVWNRLLGTYVDDEGRVAYRKLQQEELDAFNGYLRRLAEAEPRGWPRDEQLAFWINAYNSGIISAIFQGQSAKSLIGRGKLFKFWKFEAAGKKRTLDEIEHETLRKQFREPRIHFAIVCASTSCPKLRREAYVGEKLDEQLDDQARRFINDPARNRIDRQTGEIRLSKIFDWFEDDFEARGSLLTFVAQYVGDDETRAWLLSGEKLEVEHLDYDWSLNVQPSQVPERRRSGVRVRY